MLLITAVTLVFCGVVDSAERISIPKKPLPVSQLLLAGCPSDNDFYYKGVIQSPYYPSFYPPSTICYYYLTAEPGKVLRFNFTHFNLETCCDFVTIYDGENQGSKVLVQIGGPNANLSDPVTSFTSTQRFALVTFQSDALIQMTGFEFVYDSVFSALPCNRDIVLVLSGLATLGSQENFQKQLDFVSNVLTPQWQVGADKVNVVIYLMVSADHAIVWGTDDLPNNQAVQDVLHSMPSLVPDVSQNNVTDLQCVFKYAQAAVSYQADSDNLRGGIERAVIAFVPQNPKSWSSPWALDWTLNDSPP
ncbi:hypothetical protein Q1695_013806 [Nippostrongylus brasiliensis]|nr:hypothetical protein Q1695_013806 [Nippostrongylus brasiliensis]